MKARQSRFFLILLFCFTSIFHVDGQGISAHIDSLNRSFATLLKTDIEAAGRLADSMLQVSKEQDFFEGIISSNLLQGKYQRKLGNYDSAISIHTKNLVRIEDNLERISEDHKQMVWRAYGGSYYDLSMISFYQGNYDESLRYSLLSDSIQDQFFKGKNFGQESYANSKLTAKMLRGNIYYVRGEIDRAIELFEEGAKDYMAAGKYYNAAVNYHNLGNLYKDKGRLLDAINSEKKALKVAEENGFTSLQATVIGGIGQIFYTMKNYEEALTFSLEAHRLHESLGDVFGTAYTSADVGDNFKKTDQIDSAIFYYEKSLNMHEEMGNTDDVAYVLERLAGLYSELGECENASVYINRGMDVVEANNLPEERLLLHVAKVECELSSGALLRARSTVQKLLTMAGNTENISHKKDVYRIAHKVYSSVGEYRRAYEYFEDFLLYRDSIYTEEKAMEVARIAYEYELEKETSRLENEKATQELVFNQKLEKERLYKAAAIGIAVLVILAAVLTFRAYRIKRTVNRQLTENNDVLKDLRAREQRLSEEALSAKERELATMAMASLEKNNLLSVLNQKISFLEKRLGDDMKSSLKEMRKTISDSISLDNSWDSFIHRFEDVHPQFFDRLKSENPSLTINDLKLSAYLKIGMNNKEIANVSNLTVGSVKSSINRLKKKLELGPDDSVRDFMLQYA